MSVTKEQAAALYAAVFNRAPDQTGLDFWVQQDSFAEMAEAFVGHPVFEAEYGEQDNAAFVNAIYQNVLQGEGDAEGIEFWTNYLNDGASRGEFLAAFIDGALNYDGDDAAALTRKAALDNKVEVALFYTEQMGEYSNLSDDIDPNSIDVVNDPAFQQSKVVLDKVTADKATVEAAKAEIEAIVPVDRDALVEAVGIYQATLDQQTAAVKAEKAAADKAVEELDVSDDVEDVTAAVAGKVDALETAALKAGFNVETAPSLTLNDATVALIREALANDITTAQTKVDLLKAQNASAVALQEKIEAYNSVAKEINKTVVDFNAEAAKFEVLNTGTPVLDKANNKDDFAVKVGETTLKVIKGEVVVAKLEGEGDDAKWVKDADADAKFNKLEGSAALKAETLAVYNNIAKQAAAQKAIETATIQALKDAGYKVYDADEKVVAWSNVKLTADGKFVDAKGEDPALTFSIKAKGQVEVTAEAVLFGVGALEDNGTVDVLGTTDEGKEYFADRRDLPISIDKGAADSEKAVKDLQNAKDASKGFETALTEYNEAVELQKALTDATADVAAADKAVADAEKAFEKFGVNLVQAEEGVATGEVYNEDNPDELADLFVYAESLTDVENFEGPDLFFFGDKAAALIVLSEDTDLSKGKLGGDANVLEIFAIQNGADTVLYVEKAAFAGNATTNVEQKQNADLVEITLAGVKADELGFDADGFLNFA